MQISEAAGGAPAPGAEPCRFPKLEECAHFHYERVQLPKLTITLQTNIEQSLHSQHSNNDDDDIEWFMIQATSGDECWLLQRNIDNFKMLDAQLHQCIYDRKISKLPDLSNLPTIQENCNNTKEQDDDIQAKLKAYLERFSDIADNTINCGPILNWLQMDNKGHRLLVPSEESRSINTPAVAAAYSVRRYVSQARDELNLEVGDMISVIDMANPGESMWWRGKRGFQVGFFPQYCVHIIGDKVPRNMPLPPPVVGSLALTPIKPVLRKHGKLITFFRSFLLNRPSRRRLKQSGILRERVFGCDLGEHLLNTSNDIPMVLKYCSEFIEKYGIVDGIYRLSGITSNIQKLRNTFDEERIPNLYTDDILQDIHSVASLLKMYFRELPNPLCTYQLYQSFVNAVQGCHQGVRNTENDHERLLKMRETVQKLPPPHYRTLEYLMRHLARVAKHGHSTGMTTRNIAIVWAPNLLRSAELEIGGVAALQGVGVQAVVTEFLICYADLIFCDHLPNLSTTNQLSSLSPKKTTCCRPKSLAISTPAKLITLEEARNKHLLGQKEDNYIEVGGGPKNLPKKYHTVIELRKRTTSTGSNNERNTSTTKRSPLGWRSLFTKRNNNNTTITTTNNEIDDKNKNRKASTPACVGSGGGISGDLNDHKIVDIDLIDMKRKLRTVKSAESLTSTNLQYHENTTTTKIDEIDNLGPLYSLNNNRNGHNRSVSHDSYFDTLQQSQNNSLLDLSEIQLNFELEESEMRIFSEDESLVSSPRLQQHQQQQSQQKRLLLTTNPSPKKQARIVVSSPDQQSRKRTRLEDQLSDIQFIDCTTPDLTIALIHDGDNNNHENKSEEPCNKSPRNSLSFYNTKRQSLNLDNNDKCTTKLTKSLTDNNLNCKLIELSSCLTTPTTTTPQSVCYKQLSSNSDDDVDDDESPTIAQTNRNYENILTTISITYKSPRKLVETPSSPQIRDDDDYEKHANLYENVVVNVEKAIVPTSTASLPFQEATQPIVVLDDERPKSLSALDDVITTTTTNQTIVLNLSSNAVCDYNEKNSMPTINDQLSSSSSIQSSLTNIQYTPSVISDGNLIDNINDNSSVVDLTTTTNDLCGNSTDTSHGSSLNCCRLSLSKESSPRVSPGLFYNSNSSDEIVGNVKNLSCNSLINDVDDDDDDGRSKVDDLIEFSPTEPPPSAQILITDKQEPLQPEISQDDDNSIYQQVKFFRRSIHEVNALLELPTITTTEGASSSSSSSSSDTTITDGATNTTTITLPTNKQNQQILNSDHQLIEDENYDSLESDNMHVYENMNSDDMRKSPINRQVTPSTYENVEITTEKVEDERHQVCVKDLKSKFEDITTAITTTTTTNDERKLKKYINYDKDGLPPCLRARNLKYQFKTRSLDEEEFKKELITNNHTTNTNDSVKQRRKSFDENLSYKTNSLPKRLNPPKCLPLEDENFQLNKIIHLAHSTENLTNFTTTATTTTNFDSIEQQKKRERIEKYKEERRKFLHDKYRSESFKEDKDVLLSQLKLFRNKDDDSDQKYYQQQQQQQQERRKSINVGDDHSDNSLKVKTMIFEQHNKVVDDDHVVVVDDDQRDEEQQHHQRTIVELRNNRLLLKTTDLLQTKNNSNNLSNSSGNNNNNNHNNHHIHRMDERIEKRRHTYENRERETEMERLRRISLENSRSPRREKPPQTVNIKDMKAIFESKSKQ